MGGVFSGISSMEGLLSQPASRQLHDYGPQHLWHTQVLTLPYSEDALELQHGDDVGELFALDGTEEEQGQRRVQAAPAA